jgi:hypothetical protein
MTEREDSKISWITCPDCGAKIGIVVSAGTESSVQVPLMESSAPLGVSEILASAGVDLALVNVEESDEIITVTPKKFLGDLWGAVNDAIRSLNGGWIRDGRESRWEIRKEDLES